MTQEQKDLLLKDLCARLPYGIKVQYENEIFDLEYVCPMYEEVKLDNHETWTLDIEEVKPYLFPLSSMTDEQKEEYNSYFASVPYYGDNIHIHYYSVESLIEFYNKYHLDWRGLIPMGLAEDATGKNVY